MRAEVVNAHLPAMSDGARSVHTRCLRRRGLRRLASTGLLAPLRGRRRRRVAVVPRAGSGLPTSIADADACFQRRLLAGRQLEALFGLFGQLKKRHLSVQVLRLVKEPDLDRPRRSQRVHHGLRRRLVQQPQRELDDLVGDVAHGHVHPVRVAAHVLKPRKVSSFHPPFEAILAPLVLRRGDRDDAHRRRRHSALARRERESRNDGRDSPKQISGRDVGGRLTRRVSWTSRATSG
mmetsp:Transcript_19584/g.67236  ORF Transcript_19584/g.67236 Transcript_19584/m.67236 type:complete len:235 (-) Transcript_19584:98-802(-)